MTRAGVNNYDGAMTLSMTTMQPGDLDEIIDFENKKLKETIANEDDRMVASWNARWRKESLEHYLPMGWSFLARDQGQLVGYFIAQPLLFVQGQTQSLWVEHLQYSSLQARDELCELAYRLSREKHFQNVYFPNTTPIMNSVKPFRAEEWNPQVVSIKTTKV
jgi:hypothetical protein